MHLNVTIKSVSWPHFSWATLYTKHTYTMFDISLRELCTKHYSRSLKGMKFIDF